MKKYAIAVVDCRIEQSIYATLSDHADSVVILPPAPFLPTPVASHPDMLIWRCGNKIVTFDGYEKLAADAFDMLKKLGYDIICEQAPRSPQYPYDVPLNCASVGKYLFANSKTVSPTVKKIAEENGMVLAHTRQGYAKCATVTVADNAIITADRSIYAAALKSGVDTLLVSEGGVALDGYDHGFIGGASGVTDTCVLFTGDLSAHPDAQSISDFCAAHGKRAVSLCRLPLYDYGTVLFF